MRPEIDPGEGHEPGRHGMHSLGAGKAEGELQGEVQLEQDGAGHQDEAEGEVRSELQRSRTKLAARKRRNPVSFSRPPTPSPPNPGLRRDLWKRQKKPVEALCSWGPRGDQ